MKPLFFPFFSLSLFLLLLLSPLGECKRKKRLQGCTGFDPQYVVVDVPSLNSASIQEIKSHPCVNWWLELDEKLLVQSHSGSSISKIVTSNKGKAKSLITPPHQNVFLIQGHIPQRIWGLFTEKQNILLDGFDFLVFQFNKDKKKDLDVVANKIKALMQKNRVKDPRRFNFRVSLVTQSQVLVQQHHNFLPLTPPSSSSSSSSSFSPQPQHPNTTEMRSNIESAISKLSTTRWFRNVQTLSQWNRNSLSAEIKKAEEWLKDQLKAISPRFIVSTIPCRVPMTTSESNCVIGRLPGSTKPNNLIVVGAHYDTTSERPQVSAPGAEDNGSGVAGGLELALAFSSLNLPDTVDFIFYAGEEQGCYGSKSHVEFLKKAPKDQKVLLAHTMDMIGFRNISKKRRVIVETSPSYPQVTNAYVEATKLYTKNLTSLISFFPFDSDHVTYLKNSIPSVLMIEADWNHYPDYHSTRDLPKNVDPDFALEILKLSAATLIQVMYLPDQR